MLTFHVFHKTGYVGTDRIAAKADEVLLPITLIDARAINGNKQLQTFQLEMELLGMLPPGPLNAADIDTTLTDEIQKREYADDRQPDNNLLLPADVRCLQ